MHNFGFGKPTRVLVCLPIFCLSILLWALPLMTGEIEGSDHWAFQPLVEFSADSDRTATEQIDYFVERQLDAHGLKPNSEADKYTLIRRVTFGLTGLPPTPGEIESFVSDASEDAYQTLIDRLLASTAYGERWGRYWLDLARYADTNGADENMAHPNAWRYRDYVIRSLNQDKPYDRFIHEQIAGDLLPKTGDLDTDSDQIIATGFLALGPKMLAEQDKEKLLVDVVDEQIDVVTKTFLGLTVSCARCHDHKFDPISQEDYYALGGIFQSTKTMANTNHVSRWVETVLETSNDHSIVAAYERRRVAVAAEIAYLKIDEDAENRDKRLEALKKQRDELRSDGPAYPKAMSVIDGRPANMPVHIRGNHLTPTDELTSRGVIQLLEGNLLSPSIGEKSSGRLELAKWLTNPRNPLTARVMVNRVWQGHFGKGLVGSASNFGLRGEAPSHPELLDWLAVEFVNNGWSLKKLHRTIMLSETYRRSSEGDLSNLEYDPDNRYLWRQDRRRLEAEPIRDALLFVSGRLDQGGEYSLGNLEKTDSYYRAEVGGFEKLTRAIYLPVVRASGYEMFSTFDAADPSAHHQSRNTTTVPSQALFMLNSDLALDSIRELALQLSERDENDPEDVLNHLYLRLFGRPIESHETELLLPELASGTESVGDDVTANGWERICRVLIAANEFVYVN